METHVIFCSALDREVTVMLRDPATSSSRISDVDGVVCQGDGDYCTGSLCPFCASPASRVGGPPAAALEDGA
jgi:hypothetical protein